MSEKDISTHENDEIDTTNIFDEFNSDDWFWSDDEKVEEAQEKDFYHYLSICWKVFQNLFIFTVIVTILALGYIWLQNNETFKNKSFLDPVCNFVVWDIPIPSENSYCSSLAATISSYNEKLDSVKKEYAESIFTILIWIYENENFTKTKEVSFLLNKSDNKLQVLDIIEKFDDLRLDFLGLEKRRVQCEDLAIDSEDMTLSISCTAFSKWYEGNIVWFSWNKTDEAIGWTSISVANSFLNFIEKNSNDFELINKQKIFSTESVVWEQSGYTASTPFDIKLKIKF